MKRIMLMLLLSVSTTAAAQDSTRYARAESPKSETGALALSFILPGLGQVYAGEGGRGAAFMIASAVSIAMVANGIKRDRTCTEGGIPIGGTHGEQFCDSRTHNPTMATTGLALGLFSLIASMVDAPAAVRRYNAKHGLTTSDARPLLEPTSAGLRFGLAIRIP